MADPLSPHAAPATGPRDRNGHAWIETSDPMTPMCSMCRVREGDPLADAPCTAPASPPPEPAPATVLHLFSNDTDSVIAATFEDALKVMAETLGLDDLDPEAWEQVEDSSLISIHCDAEGNPAEPGSDADVGVTTKTAAEWCARGRGFLWTTEY
jgi:hypothetical protein